MTIAMHETVEVQVLSSKDPGYREVLAIRRTVFVEEQKVPAALEVDAYEDEACFFLVRVGGRALGTGRFRVKGTQLKFERIATLKEARGRGIGAALMRRMEAEAEARFPKLEPYMHAQADAVPFYEKIGWRRVGAAFFEAGIEHVAMTK